MPQRVLWDIGSRLPGVVESEESEENEDNNQERQVALADGQAEIAQHEGVQYKGGKWGQYVRAPDVWFDILETAGDRLVPLHDLAEIRRGFTSGADKFYCVRDVTDEQLKRYSSSEFDRP